METININHEVKWSETSEKERHWLSLYISTNDSSTFVCLYRIKDGCESLWMWIEPRFQSKSKLPAASRLGVQYSLETLETGDRSLDASARPTRSIGLALRFIFVFWNGTETSCWDRHCFVYISLWILMPMIRH